MTGRGAVLAGRILAELQELSILVQRAEQGWAKASESRDDFFLDVIPVRPHPMPGSFMREIEHGEVIYER